MHLKQKLENNEISLGSWITLGNDDVAEIMARCGYDWLTIDMEHSAISINQAQSMIRVIELCGSSPLVRIGANDPLLIKRVMDAGAHGIIVPMVNSRESAEKAVQAAKYPPDGTRGVGLARAQKYGSDFEGYRRWNQQHGVIIVQIEHIQAVENMESILAVSGVDGFIVGPYDLSGSLGVPGQFSHPAVGKAMARIRQVASKFPKKAPGIHVIPPGVEEVETAMRDGYRFIAHSLDILFLGESCRMTGKKLRAAIGDGDGK